MKNLDKVMKDMEKATEKLAEMLNEKEEPIPDAESGFDSEEEELTEVVEITEAENEDIRAFEDTEIRDCGCDGNESNSSPEPCNRVVRFHCIRNIPEGLRLDRVKDFRVVYDPTDLRTFVEEADISVTPPPGCPDLTLTVFAVRVVGCITVSISTLAFEGRCGVDLFPRRKEDDKVALCCNTTVCVDNVICYRGTREQAEAAAAAIQARLRSRKKHNAQTSESDVDTQHRPDPCDAVPLLFAIGRIFKVPVDCDNDKPKILAFSGAFKLPSCPRQ